MQSVMAESTYNEISNGQLVLITVGHPIRNPTEKV